MASKVEDLIHTIQVEVAKIIANLDGVKNELGRGDFTEIRERISKLEALLSVADFRELLTRIATLEEQNAELKKWKDERDRRNWQFWLGIGMCVFTFTANIVIQLVMFFARKPA